MSGFLSWYLIITLCGLAAIPIGYRLLPFLNDRGIAFARPLGLLLWGYLFWISGVLHILPNTAGGQTTAFCVLLAGSAWAGHGHWRKIFAWLKSKTRTIVVVELLFIILFAAWALVRSANPNVTGTEKPMEMAFITSILRSPSFPPNDPWLSGYAISYYYFGYVLVAMLARAAGTGIGFTFNLASALWFALTGVAAYGVLYSLINFWHSRKTNGSAPSSLTLRPLLAPLFILFVSNLEGFLEILHARGLFWKMASDGTWQSKFWSWLKIAELNQAPTLPFDWTPDRVGGILWWRASRVIQDFKLVDVPHAAVNPAAPVEIIDEFPFFSYLLADLHPHVLVMPFALLAIGLAINLYLGGIKTLGEVHLDWLRKPQVWFSAILLGSLGFLNIWDFPIYVGLFSAAYSLGRTHTLGWSKYRLGEFIKCGLMFGILGGILYAPYYLGFDSQAGGLMPSLLFFTRGINFWVMFAPLLIPVFIWLIWSAVKHKGVLKWNEGLKFGLLVVGGFWGLMMLMSIAAVNLPAIGTALMKSDLGASIGQQMVVWGNMFYGLQAGDLLEQVRDLPGQLLSQSLIRRLASPGTWITLTALIVIVWSLLTKYRRVENFDMETGEAPEYKPSATGFVLLLVLLGAGLTLVPEFVYLRDQFSTRMNTIFKFYIQTWIIWGIAASYASLVLFSELKGKRLAGFSVIWVSIMLIGLAYPVNMLPVRMSESGLKFSEWHLDGVGYIRDYNPDEAAAIEWLQQAPDGVIAEAVGGAYSSYARISVQTGLQTVIGWANHESQWRGGYEEIGSRPEDIKNLYTTKTWDEARLILEKYDIKYVYIGSLERGTYEVSDEKFDKYLRPVYQNASVVIYEVPELVITTQ